MPAPRYNVNVTMPEERMFQLRELADAMGGASMSETMKALFEAARAQGLIQNHTLPGVTINALSNGIVIQFDYGTRAPFSFEGARALAETIRQFVAGENDRTLQTNSAHNFSVQRKGRGIAVTISLSETPQIKNWNADIAAEFADLIDAAVAEKCQE